MANESTNIINPKHISLLYKVCRKLASKYTFGYYDADDITQEAFIIGMKLLQKYNRKKGMSLESFLYMSINNRLKDFKRDNYARIFHKCSYCNNEENPDTPCEYCQRRNWRIEVRKNLMKPIDIDNVSTDDEPNIAFQPDFVQDVEIAELMTIIDKELPIALRADYLRMLDGITIAKTKRELIESIIIKILESHEYYVKNY